MSTLKKFCRRFLRSKKRSKYLKILCISINCRKSCGPDIKEGFCWQRCVNEINSMSVYYWLWNDTVARKENCLSISKCCMGVYVFHLFRVSQLVSARPERVKDELKSPNPKTGQRSRPVLDTPYETIYAWVVFQGILRGGFVLISYNFNITT